MKRGNHLLAQPLNPAPIDQPDTSDREWDDELRQRGGHFLQSSAWQAVERALHIRVVRSAVGPAMWSGGMRSTHGLRTMYIPCGPVVSANPAGGRAADPAGEPAADEAADAASDAAAMVREVCTAARRHGGDFARIEPRGAIAAGELRRHGALAAPSVQPQHTVVIDLKDDEEQLRRRLAERHRRRIKGAPKQGLSFRRSTDPAEVSHLIELMHATAAHNRFHSHADDYYRTLADVLLPRGAGALFFAEAEGRVVAAVLSFDFAPTRHYAHVAADPNEGRRLGAAAPLVWYMMMDAKAAGMTSFDLWGVAPNDDPAHPWAGFTKFKKAFGGTMVTTLGTWEIPIARLRYSIYRSARRLRGPFRGR